jgi:hypothetical protein
MTENVFVGQTFKADDGGIQLIVVRVGGKNERARFKIENLRDENATYTITVCRKSGPAPDRIVYTTGNARNPEEHELSMDETTSVSIRRDC